MNAAHEHGTMLPYTPDSEQHKQANQVSNVEGSCTLLLGAHKCVLPLGAMLTPVDNLDQLIPTSLSCH